MPCEHGECTVEEDKTAALSERARTGRVPHPGLPGASSAASRCLHEGDTGRAVPATGGHTVEAWGLEEGDKSI